VFKEARPIASFYSSKEGRADNNDIKKTDIKKKIR